MRKAAFHTLGCKVNAYETEAMEQILEDAGYEIVPFQAGADAYIINTCSVTNVADKKSRQMIHRARKMNPGAAVVAVGCYVQAAEEKLKADGTVDLIIGNNRKKDLAVLLNHFFEGRERASAVADMGCETEYESLRVRKISEHTRAFIKVQDGCNQFCSYCIIPYTRGRVRSRALKDVKEEAAALAASGYKEVVLTGIHLSSYGLDFADGTGLLDLIRRIHEIPGIERIRLGSLEPRIVTEEFAAQLSSMEKICPHFHLSLQSGCDATLRRMNRHYTAEEYFERCEILRQAFKDPAITTDVIVGFPGETEEEFEETKAFLKKVHFYEMHIFKYSVREGTRAAAMPDQVPEPVKARRSDELLALEREMSAEYRRRFLGKTGEILLEEEIMADGGAWMAGHTKEYVRAAVRTGLGEKNSLITGVFSGFLDDEILRMEPEEGAF